MKTNLELNNGSDICVVMAYDDAYRSLGDMTSNANLAYCRKNNYDFRLYREGFDTSRHPSWSKLLFVKDALETHEFVYWIDSDAVFTNYDIPIRRYIRLGGDIYLGVEREMFNFGMFLIRKCEWSSWILNEMWALSKYAWTWPWEQQAFHECFLSGKVRDHLVYYYLKDFFTILLPEEWNKGMEWKEGDFAAHCWGKHSLEVKAHVLKACLLKRKGD